MNKGVWSINTLYQLEHDKPKKVAKSYGEIYIQMRFLRDEVVVAQQQKRADE